MSRKQTIVKGLNSIQNFGAIGILCTDKTGTLTQDKVVLKYHLNIKGENDTRVLCHAYLNSYFQTGYKNLIDLVIIRKTEAKKATDSRLLDLSENYVNVDEIPFDFTRRRLTTVVQDRNGKTQMLTKGAVEEMLSICAYAECGGEVQPLTDAVRSRILQTVDDLGDRGFHVLAIAQKSNPSPVGAFGVKDECDMVLIEYPAFLDPPKASAAVGIKALKDHGVTAKVLTGDNDKVTRTICRQVDLKVRNMLLSADLDGMTDAELAKAAETADVFVKLPPAQKARVVFALRGERSYGGLHGRRYQRRCRHESHRYWNLRRYRRRRGEGIGGHYPVGKGSDGSGVGRYRRTQDLRQHDQVHQDDGFLQLRQYALRAGGLGAAALPADDELAADLAEPDLQPELHGDSLGQCGRGIYRKVPKMGRFRRGQLYAPDRSRQLRL